MGLVTLTERIPKIGEFFIMITGEVYLCLGYNSYKAMTGIPLGGVKLVGKTILNFETLYPHLISNLEYFFSGREQFLHASVNNFIGVNIRQLRKDDIVGKIADAYGVVEGFSVDVNKLVLRLNKLRMLGIFTIDLHPHEYYQDIELPILLID